jgi:chromate transporter
MSSSWVTFIALYLRIGVLGFGGPQAHIAMLREEIVQSRGWVDADRFDEGLGLCEALPGPASSQMAIYLGWLQRGLLGGLISGICFLLPGLLIVLGLSELWRNGQSIPSFTTALQTLQPVIAAIIWAFAWKLLRNRRAGWQRITAGLVMLGGLLNSFSPLTLPAGGLLLLAGLSRWLIAPAPSAPTPPSAGNAGLLAPIPLLTAPLLVSSWGLLGQLFAVFFKTGLLVFGGGLVIIPLLEQQVVSLGWLNSAQFLDGVAIGQISPGPVVLTSAFVGYQAAWQEGGVSFAVLAACTATAGIFLPSFTFILVGAPFLQRLRQRPSVKTVLSGLLAGVPGAVAAAAVPLTWTAVESGVIWVQLLLFSLALRLCVTGRMKPLPLISASLMIGLLLEWLR